MARGREVTVKEVLDRGRERIQHSLTDQPEVRANLLLAVGSAYSNLGLYDESRPILREALAIARQEKMHNATARALLDLAQCEIHVKNVEDGERLTHEGLVYVRQHLEESDPLRVIMIKAVASINMLKEAFAEAERQHLEALALHLKYHPEDLMGLADIKADLALCYKEQGRIDLAEHHANEALTLDRELKGELTHGSAVVLDTLADIARIRGEYERALTLSRQALKIKRRYLGDHHYRVGVSLNNLAFSLMEYGHLGEAEKAYRETLEIYARALEPDSPELAITNNNLGKLLRQQKSYEEAARHLEEGYRIAYRRLGRKHPLTATIVLNQGLVEMDRQVYRDAEAKLRIALSIFQELLPPNHRRVGNATSILGECLWHQNIDGADELMLKGFRILDAARDRRPGEYRDAIQRLVTFHESRGDHEQVAYFRNYLKDR